MSTNKPPKSEPEVHVHDVSKLRGHLKIVGGSMSNDWNNLVANQTTRTIWFFADSDQEEIRRERHAAVDALMGIKPGDELEGMIAAQLIACHNASSEQALSHLCGFARCAQSPPRQRPAEGHGGARPRPRGRSGHRRQRRQPGGRFASKAKEQPHALTHAPPAMKNGRCRMHGGPSPGAPKGNKNALKHGRYTAQAMERRREIAALLRAMRALAGSH